MRRLAAVALTLSVVLPTPAHTAEITRIASSFEDKHPFGLIWDVGFESIRSRSKIVREQHKDGELRDSPELWHSGTEARLNLDLRIGIAVDLELRAALPVVFRQDRAWRFVSGTDASNSTISNNCIRANGELTDPNCSTMGAGNQPLFDVGNKSPNSYRGGLGNATFGLAYGIYKQEKDDTKPTWIIGIDYTAPTAEAMDPTIPTELTSRGKLGDRIHRFKFYTSFSKRMGAADPYFQLHYTLPSRGPGWYSNCDHPSPQNMGRSENCGTAEWTRVNTAIRPQHEGGVIFGSEFNVFDNQSTRRRLAFDVRGQTTYVSEGRTINELTDPLMKLLYTQEYLQLGGQLGIVADVAKVIRLRASAGLFYNTDHWLTNEAIGKDTDGSGTVDVTNSPLELNPNFDWRVDMNSRRFRATNSTVFTCDFTTSVSF